MSLDEVLPSHKDGGGCSPPEGGGERDFHDERRTNETHEAQEALEILVRQRRKHVKPQSVGGDKGYHDQWFVTELRSRGIRPHVACIEGRASEGLDGRTLKLPAYRASGDDYCGCRGSVDVERQQWRSEAKSTAAATERRAFHLAPRTSAPAPTVYDPLFRAYIEARGAHKIRAATPCGN